MHFFFSFKIGCKKDSVLLDIRWERSISDRVTAAETQEKHG